MARLLRESLQGKPWSALSETLSEPRIVEVTASGGAEGLKWPRFEGPGIQRLEHASLLIASEQAKILIDPVALAACGPLGLSNLDQSPSNMDVAIDAMLITHGHLDHWHIPSIMRYGGDGGVPVIVPRIPFPSLLAQDDMLQSLKDVGQNALAPAWGETVRIKDIEIDILPFFGEQPTLKGPLPPENVRNWGNCYRIHTPGFSVIVLVDSGTDSLGSVEEVLKQSVARRGEPDLILSCCREMTGAPFWQGLFTFWMVLPISELQKLVRSRTGKHGPSVTMGPQGIGDACVSFKAKAFAPYANGFRGIGLEIEDIGWGDGEPPEAQVLGQIESRIAEQGGDTRVIRWLPGDVLRFDSKRQCAVSTG
ncbi:MAG TPA: MBL fold metallo-hydrolase [Cystobacter sp.]